MSTPTMQPVPPADLGFDSDGMRTLHGILTHGFARPARHEQRITAAWRDAGNKAGLMLHRNAPDGGAA